MLRSIFRILGINKMLNTMGYAIVSHQSFNSNQYVQASPDTRFDQFKCEVRNGVKGKMYLSVGKNCVISGNFIFETISGKIKIGNNTFIGGGMFICIEEIDIGDDVMFSWGCTVMDNDSHSLVWEERSTDVYDWKKGLDENQIGKYAKWENVKKGKITIKNKAWIGFNSIILKGVTVGEGAVVGAGSVVTADVPDFAVVAGNPAKVIKYTR